MCKGTRRVCFASDLVCVEQPNLPRQPLISPWRCGTSALGVKGLLGACADYLLPAWRVFPSKILKAVLPPFVHLSFLNDSCLRI